MIVDVLTMLDGTLNGGSSGDIGKPGEREESFGAIFEERMKTENGKPEKPNPKSDKGVMETKRVKSKSAEDNSEKGQTESAQTITEKTESVKTDASAEKPGVMEKIPDKNTASNEIELTEEQLSKLAAMMGITMEEMAKLALLLEGKSGQLMTSMPDDMKNRLAQFLDTRTGSVSANQQETVAKLAELLDMDKEEAETLFKRLRVFSMEIKSEKNPAGKVLTDAQKPQKESKSDNNAFDTETDDFLNGSKTFGDNMEVKVKSATDQSGKVAQSNVSTHSVGTDPVNAVKTGKTTATHTTPVKETVETANKAVENKIINQIVEKAKILSFPKNTHARIALKPPSLGWVDIKIVMHENSARAAIVVESAAVKQTVDQNIDQLKAALNQQGISLEEMNVSVEHQDARSSSDGDQRSDIGYNDFIELAGDRADPHMGGGRLADEIIKAAYNSYFNITI
ncbi:MAG: flagellar hook-length control protein FliK [Nitrospinota bacterium]